MDQQYVLRKTLGPLKPGAIFKRVAELSPLFEDEKQLMQFTEDTIKEMEKWFYKKTVYNNDYKAGYYDAKKADGLEYQRGYRAGLKAGYNKALNGVTLEVNQTSSGYYNLEEKKETLTKRTLI